MSKRYFVTIEDDDGNSVELEYADRWDAGRVAQTIRQTLEDVAPENLGSVFVIEEDRPWPSQTPEISCSGSTTQLRCFTLS